MPKELKKGKLPPGAGKAFRKHKPGDPGLRPVSGRRKPKLGDSRMKKGKRRGR